MERSILLVFAHPDDESFGVAGTVSRYVEQGIPVDLVCATRGEKGTRLDVPPDIDTGTARESELRSAAAIMGIRNIYLLGYIDGELETIDPEELAKKVADIIEQAQPEVVVTFGPDGITGHSDHISISKTATAAFNKLASIHLWPRKLYYVTVPETAVSGTDFDITSRPDDEVTTVIDIREFREKKIRAIAAHTSQQDAREFVELMRSDALSDWASKEHFYLANLKVELRETDFFQ